MLYPMLFIENRPVLLADDAHSPAANAQVTRSFGLRRELLGNRHLETEGLLVRVQSREPSSQVSGHVVCSAGAATHAAVTLFVFPRVPERAFQGLGRPAAGEPAAEVDVLGDRDRAWPSWSATWRADRPASSRIA